MTATKPGHDENKKPAPHTQFPDGGHLGHIVRG
jgi:hypothetical protein